MRLIEDAGHGDLRLVEKHDSEIPRYAILSHTWGADDEEVTFRDLIEGAGKDRAGYNKIEFCRKQAVSDGLQYFWVDTCCIDKSSSAELTEAINSMFRWYQDASNCYVYLSDVSTSGESTNSQLPSTTWKAAFRQSRWFTRGWTLQELIAPTSVDFFSREGDRLGNKQSLEQEIHEITKISIDALRGTPLTEFEVEERLSWADHRETKRQEDKAYSLLGIFNVHMPLIYGEGSKAFVRLRETIHGTSLVQEQKRQRHHTITNWVSLTDFAAQQSDIISRRQDGTGVWFTDSPKFLDWLQSSTQTLFCPGIPGAGKTMISAIVVDHLWKHVRDQNIGVAYIYCNYRTQTDQKAANLAAIILKQLIQERPSIAEPVVNLYDRHADRGTRPSVEEILSALQAVVCSYSKVYVVVDALDECLNHDRTQLLAMLRELQSKGNLSFMATSRFVPEVELQFNSVPLLAVRADDSDVKRYVAGQMHRLPKCVQRDSELQKTIQDGISTAVEGMFLLARLHLDSLLDKISKKKILSTLTELPRGSKALDEVYNDAIKRINGQLSGHRTLAINVLSWITYAQRPLTTGELCHALAVELGESELDPDNIPDVEDMVSVCAGLVTIDDESNIIRLVHYTTQEYFERIRERWIPQAQQDIASVCLTYLSFDSFRSGSCQNDEEFESRLGEKLLLDYASRYWIQHIRTVQKEVYQLASRFLQDSSLVSCAVQTMSVAQYRFRGYSQHFVRLSTGLHLTAAFGLLHLTERLISELGGNTDMTADSKDENGETPLWLAARGGHEAVVKLLLKTGQVDVDCKDKHDKRTPLWLAAERGHEAVVKLLLETGQVDVNCNDKYGQAPLWLAAERRDEAVVKLLLKTGKVDVNYKDKNKHGQTPLWLAAERGHEAVVKLLLETGKVDVNCEDDFGQAPLQLAARGGNAGVVKLLLETGQVDVNCKDKYDGRTPLQLAARGGHEAVVKLLLETRKVDVDCKDNNGKALLWLAAERGHEVIVKLLLETGKVDVNCKNKYGQTPLWLVAERGNEAMVKLLLDTGEVNVNCKDDFGQAPLQLAARGGHEVVTKLLLETGQVDVNCKDEYEMTPLWLAARGGHEAVVKLLLETGQVDVNCKDNNGEAPLQLAAKGGHEAVVKLLLETEKVSVDCIENDYGQTPLWLAAERGHEAVVKLLLETGQVDVNWKDKHKQRTPLWLAAERGREAVVKLLLETGKVDVDCKDNHDERTPLQLAARGGHTAVVELLLETGEIDVDCKDKYGQTPLQLAAERGYEAVVKLLLETGQVDVDGMDNDYGQTPLQLAAEGGHAAVIKLLLETGKVDVNYKNDFGQAPLQLAARGGHAAVAKLLLETGQVDVNCKDQFGQTPLQLAAESVHEALVKLLLETGKVDVNCKYQFEQTPLELAAQGGHEAVVKLLLETGKVDVNCKNQFGQTPLELAARGGHEAVVKLLRSEYS